MLIVDDHVIVRKGMKQLFSLADDISVAAEASNGGQVLDLLRQNSFDIILLDMSMSGISGTSLISRVRIHSPQIPILILSMYNDPQIVKRALNAGASGYLTKDSEPEIVLLAIRKVAQGGRFIAPELAEKIVFSVTSSEDSKLHKQLSDREYEIFLLLVKGNSLNEIASEFSISSKTVSTHKMRLMQKMSITNNADLVRYAMENNFFGDDL
ncbi:MAG: DNA-binding NarL/FixJ family response regulator [Colwellia sp.]|jgi:DNA-binding NarL/FixJ family response regulator